MNHVVTAQQSHSVMSDAVRKDVAYPFQEVQVSGVLGGDGQVCINGA